MSKSDQFAVPADAPVSSSSKPSPSRIVGWGCGGVTVLLVAAIVITLIQASAIRRQPVDKTRVLQSLAGVPLYPGATFDEEGTQDARAGLAASKAMVNMAGARMETVAGLRTSADLKDVIPFYDANMAIRGFSKTTLGSGNGASYVSPDTTVVVQMESEAGEDNRLVLYRFDRNSRAMLKQATNVVLPQDFEKAKKEAVEKKKQQEQAEAPKK